MNKGKLWGCSKNGGYITADSNLCSAAVLAGSRDGVPFRVTLLPDYQQKFKGYRSKKGEPKSRDWGGCYSSVKIDIPSAQCIDFCHAGQAAAGTHTCRPKGNIHVQNRAAIVLTRTRCNDSDIHSNVGTYAHYMLCDRELH